MKIQNVKGGYDYSPKEQRIRNYINDILKDIFQKFGYNSIETPILCYYDILSDKYDENSDILKEIYKLKDQGKRNLGLRYDLTVPFAKFIALNKKTLEFPFKRYEIAKVFRDGPVKVGRDREFTQCDADVVGIGGELIEAELLSLYKMAFNKLGIEIIIYYNSRKLMTGLILESGIDESLVSSVTTIMDKKDKITYSELNEYLKEIGLDKKQIKLLNQNFSLNLDDLKKKYSNTNNEILRLGINEVINLTNYLNKLELSDICKFNITLARGQNYYTGNVFEVYDKLGRVKSSIGGGGRYDKIIGNFINDGNNYPAVGISFGLSSIYEILKNTNIFNNQSLIDFYIIPLATECESLFLANRLRSFGYKVEIEMTKRKLKKSMEYANRNSIPYVIVLGEDEVLNKNFKIKDMLNYKEISVSYSDLNDIKEILNKNI